MTGVDDGARSTGSGSSSSADDDNNDDVNDDDNNDDDGPDTTTVIGVVAGAVGGLALLLVGGYFIFRKRAKKAKAKKNSEKVNSNSVSASASASDASAPEVVGKPVGGQQDVYEMFGSPYQKQQKPELPPRPSDAAYFSASPYQRPVELGTPYTQSQYGNAGVQPGQHTFKEFVEMGPSR